MMHSMETKSRNGTLHQRNRSEKSSDEESFEDQNLDDEESPNKSRPNWNLSLLRTTIPYLYFLASIIAITLSWHTTSYIQTKTIHQKDELLFFNVPTGKLLAPLSSAKYPKNGPVIATLVTNSTKDIHDLRIALQSLMFLQEGDDSIHPAPVLIFNEGDLTGKQVEYLVSSTYRPVAFPIVDLTTFPEGFKPLGEDGGPEFYVKNRKPWGYYQMIRFWITGIWKHPALEQFETVMRIDSDSCFKSENPFLPNFAHDQLVYHSQFMGYEAHGDKFVEGLYTFVHKYIHENGIQIQNPLLWQFISTTWEAKGTLPLYNTNFEVSRKSFMQRKDVMDFHESLTDRPPFGVLTHRWGDAVTRMLTTSIFAKDELIMQSAPEGYFHKDQCLHDEVVDKMRTFQMQMQTGK